MQRQRRWQQSGGGCVAAGAHLMLKMLTLGLILTYPCSRVSQAHEAPQLATGCPAVKGHSRSRKPRPAAPAVTSSATARNEAAPVRRLIVMFDDYRDHGELADKVRAKLQEPSATAACSGSIVTRNNRAAAQFPTDFVLLDISECSTDDDADMVMALLRAIPDVTSVTTEKHVRREPLAADPTGHRSPRTRGHSSAWAKSAQRRGPMGVADLLRGGASGGGSLLTAMRARSLWELGYKGQGIRVAVFDTGLGANHPDFTHVEERTNWTDEDDLNDGIGHGTFVAGVVASVSHTCPGLAPAARLHIYRVFTSAQVSYTSWFLDAFNYALFKKVHVLNLSIGGPDYMDEPFVAKVNEITTRGIVMVSAIGNDGPVFGTLNNPGDQNNVIGVGGIDFNNRLAPFSSRGMTLWELPGGYGRVKPDIVTYGAGVAGPGIFGGCHTLSGTSVASPVVTGAAALLASVIPPNARGTLLNPASMKQALLHTASRLRDGSSIFEQGAGRVNLTKAAVFLDTYTPHASAWPPLLNMSDCPYFSPYCEQSLYHDGQPLVVNFTILNGMAPTGSFAAQPEWRPLRSSHASLLQLAFTTSSRFSSWAGNLGVKATVAHAGRMHHGVVRGVVRVVVESPSPAPGHTGGLLRSTVEIPLEVSIMPTPPRERRLLWDAFHSLPYPPGYFPRDALRHKTDPLDWSGDHPHTNYRTLARHLATHGYHLEVLGTPYTCVDFRNYAALIVVDPEEEFFQAEIQHLREAVDEHGTGLLVLADWYNSDVMRAVEFFDENTRNWWSPETGGSNVPALNDLLGPWGIALSNVVLEGKFSYRDHIIQYQSGTAIGAFPSGGVLVSALLAPQHVRERRVEVPAAANRGDDADVELEIVSGHTQRYPVIGLYDQGGTGGRIAVYGDSTCVDDKHNAGQQSDKCLPLMQDLLEFVLNHNERGEDLLKLGQAVQRPLEPHPDVVPARRDAATLYLYSRVLADKGLQRPLPMCPHDKWLGPVLQPPSKAPAAEEEVQREEQPQGDSRQQRSGRKGVGSRIHHTRPKEEQEQELQAARLYTPMLIVVPLLAGIAVAVLSVRWCTRLGARVSSRGPSPASSIPFFSFSSSSSSFRQSSSMPALRPQPMASPDHSPRTFDV